MLNESYYYSLSPIGFCHNNLSISNSWQTQYACYTGAMTIQSKALYLFSPPTSELMTSAMPRSITEKSTEPRPRLVEGVTNRVAYCVYQDKLIRVRSLDSGVAERKDSTESNSFHTKKLEMSFYYYYY